MFVNIDSTGKYVYVYVYVNNILALLKQIHVQYLYVFWILSHSSIIKIKLSIMKLIYMLFSALDGQMCNELVQKNISTQLQVEGYHKFQNIEGLKSQKLKGKYQPWGYCKLKSLGERNQNSQKRFVGKTCLDIF